MKKIFSILSVAIFVFNFVVYSFFLRGVDIVPDKAFFPLLIGGSIVGFILARVGNKKGALRNLGTFGNAFVLVIAVILPILVRTFIWNEP